MPMPKKKGVRLSSTLCMTEGCGAMTRVRKGRLYCPHCNPRNKAKRGRGNKAPRANTRGFLFSKKAQGSRVKIC